MTTTMPIGTSKPISAVATPTDRDFQSTWTHRAWVAIGCTSVLVCLAKSVMAASERSPVMWFVPLLAGYFGYLLMDLTSGFYHWAFDNYGDASTPLFGSQIEAFQHHHKWPWMVTRIQFANNIHKFARALAFVVVPIDFVSKDMVVHAFVGVYFGCIMFSLQIHAWAHGTKSRLPPLVVALQDASVLISPSQHDHHHPPHNNSYCSVSGVWNEFLERKRVFEKLEMELFLKFGVRPRSWNEPSSDSTEEIKGD
ncbi:fatty acid desaturase 4, chloroplastic-like [Macadamia integrifolia]|uniref:fatty acid desaturase 4, chloroplastic-like n=1 Tax=Macadamia integrifolia TaxID=60698 RepID=UPI001C52A093|nr:fatty acid desaturase 4, chloroplastic-like [Macadamia integrifolia]